MEPRQRATKILAICRGDPADRSGAGERQRLALGVLRQIGDVTVVALTKSVDTIGASDASPQTIRTVPLVGRRVHPLDYFAALVRWRPRVLAAARLHTQRRLIEAATAPNTYDLVWAYTDRVVLSLPRSLRSVPLVADLVDFEGKRNLDAARSRGRWGVTHRANVDQRALRCVLRRIRSCAQLTLISSELDRTRLGLSGVDVLPNSYKRFGEPRAAEGRPRSPTFLFAGRLSYGPNRSAADWLVDEIWPQIRRRLPGAELRIVGRGLPTGAYDGVDGVSVLGEIESMRPELVRATAALVPLKLGCGTRIKIIEAWAYGVPVVSTNLGAEGLGAKDHEHLLLADDAESFAAAAVRLHDDSAIAQRLILGGLELFERTYSAVVVEQEYLALLGKLRVIQNSPNGSNC
ncbi:MAG: glycosyltransferase [Actinomycetota bacterium]